MNKNLPDENSLFDALEEQRKILEGSVEKEKLNLQNQTVLHMSERMDRLVAYFYRQVKGLIKKENPNQKTPL